MLGREEDWISAREPIVVSDITNPWVVYLFAIYCTLYEDATIET